MPEFLTRAALVVVGVLLAGCSSLSPGGDAPPAPSLWSFESLAWYRWMNKVSMNSTVGPISVGRTVLYGGTYGYSVAGQETTTSRLALVDAATGRARWRMEYDAAFGPIALQGGTIVVAAGNDVLGLDLGSGAERWRVPVRARTLTAAGDAVLIAGREMIHAIDPVSGTRRWQRRATTDPVASGDTALFMDGQTLRAVATGDGAERWSLELPIGLAYPQSLEGAHAYILGASSLGSVNMKSRRLEWVASVGSAPTAGITATDDMVYFTTRSASGSSVFHAFDPHARADRWSRALDSSPRVAPIVMGPLVAVAATSGAESLLALSRGTGAVAWSARTGAVPVQPLLSGNVLYVAGQGPNRIYAFRADTGAVLWSGRLWGWPMGMALAEDGTLLVAADNLTLYAYRTN